MSPFPGANSGQVKNPELWLGHQLAFFKAFPGDLLKYASRLIHLENNNPGLTISYIWRHLGPGIA